MAEWLTRGDLLFQRSVRVACRNGIHDVNLTMTVIYRIPLQWFFSGCMMRA